MRAKKGQILGLFEKIGYNRDKIYKTIGQSCKRLEISPLSHTLIMVKQH